MLPDLMIEDAINQATEFAQPIKSQSLQIIHYHQHPPMNTTSCHEPVWE